MSFLRRITLLIISLSVVVLVLLRGNIAQYYPTTLNPRSNAKVNFVSVDYPRNASQGISAWIGSPKNISLRSNRFPSVEERIRLYLADWYLPPCPSADAEHSIRYKYNPSASMHQVMIPNEGGSWQSLNFTLLDIPTDTTFSLDRYILSNCSHGHEWRAWDYCVDVLHTMLPLLDNVGWGVTGNSHRRGEIPLLLQFGDRAESVAHGFFPLPVITKFRFSMTTQQFTETTTKSSCSHNLQSTSLRPIIWKLQTDRHFNRLPKVQSRDRPWEQKIAKAIFRGAMTGFHYSDLTDPVERCMTVPRCRLVYMHANSTLLDAKVLNTFGFVPNVTNGVLLTGPRMEMNSLLKYKVMVFLEGNDVSSGVKWALYSQSVVLMPRPTVTSWAMEELLQEWVHYVPIRVDLMDVEEKIQWVLDHDTEARAISMRATLWIHDLVFHPDAAKDDEAINREILQRYRSHWRGAEFVREL